MKLLSTLFLCLGFSCAALANNTAVVQCAHTDNADITVIAFSGGTGLESGMSCAAALEALDNKGYSFLDVTALSGAVIYTLKIQADSAK